MAKQRFGAPGADQTVRTVLWDALGNPIVEVGAREYMVHRPDGSVATERINSSILLMDGTMWHPGMRDVRLGVCKLCREPPYTFPFRQGPMHGLVSLTPGGAVKCARCGMILCPAHARRCSDNRLRCPSCAQRGTLRRFFERIFWTTDED